MKNSKSPKEVSHKNPKSPNEIQGLQYNTLKSPKEKVLVHQDSKSSEKRDLSYKSAKRSEKRKSFEDMKWSDASTRTSASRMRKNPTPLKSFQKAELESTESEEIIVSNPKRQKYLVSESDSEPIHIVKRVAHYPSIDKSPSTNNVVTLNSKKQTKSISVEKVNSRSKMELGRFQEMEKRSRNDAFMEKPSIQGKGTFYKSEKSSSFASRSLKENQFRFPETPAKKKSKPPHVSY